MGFGERQVHVQILPLSFTSCILLAELTSPSPFAEWAKNYATGISEA